jgi:hypothetical protein
MVKKRKVKRQPTHSRKQPVAKVNTDSEELFDAVIEDVVRSNGELFKNLTDYERNLVIKWLADSALGGHSAEALHDTLWEKDFIRKPVSIDQFIHDDYYLGSAASELHPLWKRDLNIVFAPGSKIFEWVLTGGIGIGKTTIACIAIAYKIHCLSCLKDPSRYYGLLSESMVVFGIYSITKRQVADAGYFKLKGFIDSSPYFRNEFPRSTKIDSKVVFKGGKVQVVPGSQELHALGLDLFAFLMDEVNFMRSKNDTETGKVTGQAYDLYNATYTRLLSRFIRPGGTLPGLMLLLSSRNSQTSFLEEHLKLVKDSPSTFVSDYPLWAVKPAHKFTAPKFRVEVGDRVSPSRLLLDGEEPRKGSKVVAVPGEFLKPFKEDIDQALRDIAGIATFNLSPLIKDRQSMLDAVSTGIAHPFTQTSITLDILDDTLIEDFWEIDKVCRVKDSKWVPKLNPNHPRFIHIDNALTGDSLGIAMGHVAGLSTTTRVNPDGTKSKVKNPHAVLDFMLQIRPPVGSEIDLSKVRAFVIYLSALYPIERVTMDGFQSRDAMQILKKEGINVGYLSVDRDDEAYVHLRSALFDRRLSYYEYEPFMTELQDLERDILKKKVDHPIRNSRGGKGSKDVADAVAGVIWHCINDKNALLSVNIEFQPENINTVEEVSRTVTKTTPQKDPTKTPTAKTVSGTSLSWDDLTSKLSE